MPIFICAKCGCIDNTATSSYWLLDIGNVGDSLVYHPSLEAYKHKPLCSECGRVVGNKVVPGKWHGKFPKEQATAKYRRRVNPTNGIIE